MTSHSHQGSGRESKGSTSGSQRSNATLNSQMPTVHVPSFLFVVHEHRIRDGVRLHRDQWMNVLPPLTRHDYQDFVPGTVFRYDDGVVTVAENYFWQRPEGEIEGHPREGGIYYRYHDDDDDGTYGEDGQPYKTLKAMEYTTHSIFACSESPCLGIIVATGDVSIYDSFMRPLVGTKRVKETTSDCCWDLLHFQHRNAVSLAIGYPYGQPYVAGKNPSWIPSLVPHVFENPWQPQIESRGLAGEVGVVIGLMAFHGPRDNPSEVFARNCWQNNTWHGPTSKPAYHPSRQQRIIPRGFLVHVCFDHLYDPTTTPEREFNDMFEALRVPFEAAEATGVWVRENRP